MSACSRIADERGLTALELIIGVGVLATLGLVLLGLLRASILSSGRSAERTFILSAARKALGGSDAFNGIVSDCQQATDVKALNPGKLSLGTPEGSWLTYDLPPSGRLLYSGPETGGLTIDTKAKGLAGLSFRYYGRGADYRVFESTAATGASLVTVSFEVPAKARTLRLFAGSRLLNHQ